MVPTERKIALIDALSETGLKEIQVASFVNPIRVPGWADAEEVGSRNQEKAGRPVHALWLNEKGFERAVRFPGLFLKGSIQTCASETFLKMNQHQDFQRNIAVQNVRRAL